MSERHVWRRHWLGPWRLHRFSDGPRWARLYQADPSDFLGVIAWGPRVKRRDRAPHPAHKARGRERV